VNPLVFIALWAAVCAGAFLIGLRFFRMTEPRGEITVAQAQRFGRLLMMSATAMLFFLGAIWLHGDLKGLRVS
jgi:hypothetical protein